MTTLEADTETTETNQQEEILDRIRLFVSQERAADDMADQGSLDRAADVVALYEKKQWMRELPPLTVRRNRGRPVDPESFSRFTKWLAEKTGLQGRRAYQLRDGHDLQTIYLNDVHINPTGEFAVRPLKWLTKNGYESEVGDVWSQACTIADGKPQAAHVRQALREWKKEHIPKKERSAEAPRGAQAVVDKWLRDAHRIMEDYPELFVAAVNKIEAEAEQYFAPGKVS